MPGCCLATLFSPPPRSMLLPQCETPSSTPTHNSRQAYCFVYFNVTYSLQCVSYIAASCGASCCVVMRSAADVLKDCSAFIFRFKLSGTTPLMTVTAHSDWDGRREDGSASCVALRASICTFTVNCMRHSETQTREGRQERDGLQNLLCHTVIPWQGAGGGEGEGRSNTVTSCSTGSLHCLVLTVYAVRAVSFRTGPR